MRQQTTGAIGLGALLGLLAVISGALGAHALADTLTPEQLGSYETAVRFQMYHALAFMALGIIAKVFGPSRWLAGVWWSWLLGTLMFSGSIYALVLTPANPWFVTPMGGLFLMVGWALLGVWAFLQQRQ